MDDVKNWFAAHTTSAHFVKGLISFGVGFLFAEQAAILANLPSWIAPLVGAGILGAHDWIANNTKWPILGAKGTAVKPAVSSPTSDRLLPPKV